MVGQIITFWIIMYDWRMWVYRVPCVIWYIIILGNNRWTFRKTPLSFSKSPKIFVRTFGAMRCFFLHLMHESGLQIIAEFLEEIQIYTIKHYDYIKFVNGRLLIYYKYNIIHSSYFCLLPNSPLLVDWPHIWITMNAMGYKIVEYENFILKEKY